MTSTSSKIISFTIPLALTQFNVILDDGRIYYVERTSDMIDDETIIAEVVPDGIIPLHEYTDDTNQQNETNSDLKIIHTTTLIGKLVDEPIGDDIILAYTIREGVTIAPRINNSLLLSLGSTFTAATNLVTNELRKIDQTYHVTDKIKELDEQYKVSETTKKATERVVENVTAIDQQYKISATVQSTASSINEKYHVTDHVKSAATYATNATIAASNIVVNQATTINETYHVTDNMKTAVDVVTTKAHEIDEKYHVIDTVKNTAEAVVKKANETLLGTTTDEDEASTATTTGEPDPDMDEETHFHK